MSYLYPLQLGVKLLLTSVIVSLNIFNQNPCRIISNSTKGNFNKGSLVNTHLTLSKLHVEKLGYTVKFQEAVQSNNAASSA